MKFSVKPEAMLGTFAVPSSVVDKHIKMASAAQLKVLLCVFRNPFLEISAASIAERLRMSESDVCDALKFWAEAELLNFDGESEAAAPEPKKTVRAAALKPTREEVARRGLENREIAYLLQQAEQKFGRALRQNEQSTLVWLHDDEGMAVSVLLMLIEFAISDGKANIGFIEKTAVSWLDSGVETLSDAESKINEIYRNRSSWAAVCRAFGLERRLPGKKEQEFAERWINEVKMSDEMLREAYSRCVDNTGKYSLPYINKILEKWHKEGVTEPSQIVDDEKPQSSFGSYDKSLIDRLQNAIDEQ